MKAKNEKTSQLSWQSNQEVEHGDLYLQTATMMFVSYINEILKTIYDWMMYGMS